MRIVRVYETQDGKQFDCRKEATIHELKLDAEKKLAEVLKISMKTCRPEAVVKEMIEEASAVREILLGMISRMPKKKAQKSKISVAV